MRRSLLIIGLLALPVTALALDYTKSSDTYKDAPFNLNEAAGISVLTNLGAVSGNPDGTFAAERGVNRAEFLKIAFLSHPNIAVSDNDADDCFPDVKATDWFSKYVCLAQRRGDVAGYPDGLFRPGNPVNYAEALKMLGELYDVVTRFEEPEHWYTPYKEGAGEAGVDLGNTMDNRLDKPLTRGEVARLAAAYRAYHDNELSYYRQFERGITPDVSASSSRSSRSSASSQSLSSSSSVSSASSASSVSSVIDNTVRSHFLLLGRTTPMLIDGLFTSENEDALVRSAEVELFENMESIDTLLLVDGNGNQIMELNRRGTSDELEKQWEGSISEASAYRMTKGTATRLGLKAKLKSKDNGGGSDEMFELENWSIRVQGVDSGTYTQPILIDEHRVLHQTALGRITSVRNTAGPANSQVQGTNRLLGTFRFTAETVTGATLHIKEMNFLLETMAVSLARPRIGGAAAVEQQDCAIEQTTVVRITCPVIPESKSMFVNGSAEISVYADLTLQSGSTSGTIQIKPDGRGSIGTFGAIRWSDGGGTFTWIEADVPLETGPIVTVTK